MKQWQNEELAVLREYKNQLFVWAIYYVAWL